MAAVAPLPPAAPALLPIAPLLAPAVPHLFTRCRPVGANPELDWLRVPMGCGVYRAFPLLGWVDVSGVFPGHAAAPALSLQGVLCAPMHLDWGTAAADVMLQLSELLTMVDLGPLARFADAQEGLGLFGRAYNSTRAHLDALEMALPRCPQPSPFLLGAGELVVPSPFLVPATLGVAAAPGVAAIPAVLGVAAVPAIPAIPPVAARAAVVAGGRRPAQPAVLAVAGVPGVPAVRAIRASPAVPAVPPRAAIAAAPARSPTELDWLHKVRLGSRVDQTSIFPFQAFLRTSAVAPDRCSQVARDDPDSLVREVSDSLKAAALAQFPALGNAALARQFPSFSASMELLPSALRSHSFDSDVLGREMLDAISYAGEPAMQDRVTASRLNLIGRDYPSVYGLLSPAPGAALSVSVQVTVLRSLAPLGLGYRAGASLFDCIELVDALLLKHAAFLAQALNKGLAISEVVRLLKLEAAEWKDAATADSTGDGATLGLSRNAVSLKGVTDAALRRAIIESDDFLQVADEIEGLDLGTAEGRLGALEIALLSGLSIFQRFFANPGCLTTKHPVFASLTLCLSAMPAYLGRAQAADPVTGEISELRASWLFHQDQCDKLFRGQLSSMSWFQRPFGALALLNLDASEPFEDCPFDQLYIVETVIEELIPFVRSTMIAAGWAAESKGGYTLHGLFQRQLAHLKWIRKQGELEVDALLPHAQATFIAALLDCDLAHARLLAHPEPAVAKLDFLLPFDGPYDSELKSKTAGAAPIIHMRRAFPGLFAKSSPRSLAGVSLPAAASDGKAVGSGGSGKGGGGGGRGGGKGGGRGGRGGKGDGGDGGGGGGATVVKAPGSMQNVAKWVDSTHLRLGELIYDTAKIGEHYSLDPNHCYPVLLSTKKGGHALALCQHWGDPGHTSLTSAAHVIPKQFDYSHVCNHFATKAPGAGEAGKKRKLK